MITPLLLAALIEKYGDATSEGMSLSVTDQELMVMDASRVVHEWYDPLRRHHILFLTRPVIEGRVVTATVATPPELLP